MMSRTISFVNSKGGAGKTTLASTLAVHLDKEGLKVLLVDADPEGSLMQWYTRRDDKGGLGCMAVPLSKLSARLSAEKSSGEWDWIVIDTPGRLEEIRPALMTDLVVIPVQSGGHDLIRFTRAWAVCRSVGAKVMLVPNRVKSGTRSEDFMGPTLQLLTENAAVVSDSMIHDRVGHGSGGLEGLTLLDIETPNSPGVKEILSVFDHIKRLVNGEAQAEVA